MNDHDTLLTASERAPKDLEGIMRLFVMQNAQRMDKLDDAFGDLSKTTKDMAEAIQGLAKTQETLAAGLIRLDEKHEENRAHKERIESTIRELSNKMEVKIETLEAIQQRDREHMIEMTGEVQRLGEWRKGASAWLIGIIGTVVTTIITAVILGIKQ